MNSAAAKAASSDATTQSLLAVLADTKLDDRGRKLVANPLSERLFDAYNLPHDPDVGHDPRPEIYGPTPTMRHGYFKTRLTGTLPVLEWPDGLSGDGDADATPPKIDTRRPKLDTAGNVAMRHGQGLRIAYSVLGDAGPIMFLLHGVPMNRRMKYPLMRKMARHARVCCLDMLGMGQSSMPLDFPWSWDIHAAYVPGLVEYVLAKEFDVSPDTPVFFQSDDWGSGAHMKVAELEWARRHIAANLVLHPIAFSGYFIAEIGAIGRASGLPWPAPAGEMDAFGQLAMGALDQSLVQIEKSMVGDAHDVTNQWQQRDDLFPYVETDYERNDSEAFMAARAGGVETDAAKLLSLMRLDTPHVYTPLTRRLRMWNVRVLSQQASMLRPAALQPYHPDKNPQGIQYDRIAALTPEFQVAWNGGDSMMPGGQVHHFKNALMGARVRVLRVPGKGHFAEKSAADFLASSYLEYMQEVAGVMSLAQPFLGLATERVWKGDEAERLAKLEAIWAWIREQEL